MKPASGLERSVEKLLQMQCNCGIACQAIVYKGLRVPGPHRKRHETNGREGRTTVPAHVHLTEHPNAVDKPSTRGPSAGVYTFQVVSQLQNCRTQEASGVQTIPPKPFDDQNLSENDESPTCRCIECHCLQHGEWCCFRVYTQWVLCSPRIRFHRTPCNQGIIFSIRASRC
jgi:hypothetical protein